MAGAARGSETPGAMKPAAAPNLLLAQRAASPEPSRSDASIAHRPFVERGRSETAPLPEGAGGSGEIAPLPIGGRGGGGRNEPRFRKSRQRRMLALIGAVCAAPVLASYLAYYILQPAGRTNYGALVEPQRPTPPLALHALDGTSYPAAALRGRWVMLQVAGGACDGRFTDERYQRHGESRRDRRERTSRGARLTPRARDPREAVPRALPRRGSRARTSSRTPDP